MPRKNLFGISTASRPPALSSTVTRYKAAPFRYTTPRCGSLGKNLLEFPCGRRWAAAALPVAVASTYAIPYHPANIQRPVYQIYYHPYLYGVLLRGADHRERTYGGYNSHQRPACHNTPPCFINYPPSHDYRHHRATIATSPHFGVWTMLDGAGCFMHLLYAFGFQDRKQ